MQECSRIGAFEFYSERQTMGEGIRIPKELKQKGWPIFPANTRSKGLFQRPKSRFVKCIILRKWIALHSLFFT